jgi:DNA polymerase elongation subunit (family B)
LLKELPDGTMELTNVETGEKTKTQTSLVVSREEAFSSFEQAVLDALQSAYKVTANSLYGQIGSRTSPIFWKDIAACTTATGREMIMLAKDFVEERYGAKVIYGDRSMFPRGSRVVLPRQTGLTA